MHDSIITHSPEETEQAGRSLARILPTKALVCFSGALGSGKTTLLKGLIAELTGCHPATVDSPTFTYLHPFDGKRLVYHFDLYRMTDYRDFLSKGFDEYLEMDATCCIEWAEKIGPILPSSRYQVKICYTGPKSRTIDMQRLS
ncbi:MAG: tRNA (adenosine(37)-N6)-threonylcarbamoyltransferase complex ATPase subunit type 1 TsaE [Chlamydiota bacterium]